MPAKDLMFCDRCQAVEMHPYLTAESDHGWQIGREMALCKPCQARVDIWPCEWCATEFLGKTKQDAGLYEIQDYVWICPECVAQDKLDAEYASTDRK